MVGMQNECRACLLVVGFPPRKNIHCLEGVNYKSADMLKKVQSLYKRAIPRVVSLRLVKVTELQETSDELTN